MRTLKKYDGHAYLMMCIDAFRKFAWAIHDLDENGDISNTSSE